MIKIRYADLPGGLHVRVAASGKDTIIYLLPGLTAMQRRAALRRARSSARMGHGPGLPTAGVAGAMAADGIRTTLRNAAAAMRAHPAIFVPPMVIIACAAIAYVLLVSVTIKVHSPQDVGPGNAAGVPIAAGVAPPPAANPPQGPGGQPAQTTAAPGHSGSPTPKQSSGGHHPTGSSPSPVPSATKPGTSPGPPGSSPSPSPTSVSPEPSASPSPNPGGSNSGTSGSGGLCLDVGPLGVCLSV